MFKKMLKHINKIEGKMNIDFKYNNEYYHIRLFLVENEVKFELRDNAYDLIGEGGENKKHNNYYIEGRIRTKKEEGVTPLTASIRLINKL